MSLSCTWCVRGRIVPTGKRGRTHLFTCSRECGYHASLSENDFYQMFGVNIEDYYDQLEEEGTRI